MLNSKLDNLDRQILAELQEDGRRSYREIGARLGVAPGTVRARTMSLMEDGVVEVIATPNPWRMGFAFFAILGLKVDDGHDVEVAEILAARQEFTYVSLVATGFDVIAEIALEDAQEFGRYKHDLATTLPGLRSIEVFVLWDVKKLRYRLGVHSADEDIES